MVDTTIGDYEVMEQLGKGSFGSVVKAFHRKTLEKVAIKIENKQMAKNLFLLMEHETLKVMQDPGVPKLIDFFSIGETNYLVLELLGPNLYTRFTQSGRKFSAKTILMIADQALSRIALVHKKSYIHRDIKPENFVTGLNGNQNQIYLIDFGLAKKYYNESCGMHIPYKEDKAFAGTLEFASRNCHLGVQMSRRDDLESFLYMLIYFFKGRLPWLDHSVLEKTEKNAKVRAMKLAYNPNELTEGLPSEIRELLKYVLRLEFDETPDYEMMRRSIRRAGHAMEFRFDWLFDWVPQGTSKARRKSELPSGFIQSAGTPQISRDKRNSVRGEFIKARPGKTGKTRKNTCNKFKRMMLSMDFANRTSSINRSSCRNMTEHPMQPIDLEENGSSSDSQHDTIKESSGPAFRNRDKILKAASEHANKVSCSVF